MSARSLADFLDAESGIGRLSAQAERLMKLQRIFEKAIPTALARHGRVANLKPGKLVIHAENGAVAVKIRQLAPRLTDSFRHEGVDLNEIQVRVQPLHPAFLVSDKKSPATIGDKQKQGLTSLAGHLPEDSPLRQSLQRLLDQAAPKPIKR